MGVQQQQQPSEYALLHHRSGMWQQQDNHKRRIRVAESLPTHERHFVAERNLNTTQTDKNTRANGQAASKFEREQEKAYPNSIAKRFRSGVKADERLVSR